MSEPLHIQMHVGLGDCMIMNGMIRVLNETFSEIVLPAWAHNVETVREMFADLPGIKVEPVDYDGISIFGNGKRVLRLGYYSGLPFDKAIFDKEFYRHAGVDFQCRWSKCKVQVPEGFWSYPSFGEPYAFVHEDKERGFHIDMERVAPEIIINPDKRVSFFRNIGLIQGAKEVHCIDSSLLSLCDSLPPVEGQKLFLHSYARDSIAPTLKKPWVILK